MYETKLIGISGWVGGGGGHKENLFHGGYRYFLEPHNAYLGMALLKKIIPAKYNQVNIVLINSIFFQGHCCHPD